MPNYGAKRTIWPFTRMVLLQRRFACFLVKRIASVFGVSQRAAFLSAQVRLAVARCSSIRTTSPTSWDRQPLVVSCCKKYGDVVLKRLDVAGGKYSARVSCRGR